MSDTLQQKVTKKRKRNWAKNRDILKSELDKNKQKDSVVRTALGREGATSPRVAQDNVDRVK